MAFLSLEVQKTTAFETGRPSGIGLGSLMIIRSVLTRPRQWRNRVRDRRHLCELSDRALSDIGLTRWDVLNEAAKPFWRPLDPLSGRS
jgi:uncharacterized protein YjiS (DUF1127 family)